MKDVFIARSCFATYLKEVAGVDERNRGCKHVSKLAGAYILQLQDLRSAGKLLARKCKDTLPIHFDGIFLVVRRLWCRGVALS